MWGIKDTPGNCQPEEQKENEKNARMNEYAAIQISVGMGPVFQTKISSTWSCSQNIGPMTHSKRLRFVDMTEDPAKITMLCDYGLFYLQAVP